MGNGRILLWRTFLAALLLARGRLPISANYDSVQRFATETTVHRSTPQGAEVVQILCGGVQKQENESAPYNGTFACHAQ